MLKLSESPALKHTTLAYVDENKRLRQKKWAAEAENGCWIEKMGAGGAEISLRRLKMGGGARKRGMQYASLSLS